MEAGRESSRGAWSRRLAFAAAAGLAIALSGASIAAACKPAADGAWSLKHKFGPADQAGVKEFDFRVGRCPGTARDEDPRSCVLDLKMRRVPALAGPGENNETFTFRLDAEELRHGNLRYRADDPDANVQRLELALNETRGSVDLQLKEDLVDRREYEFGVVLQREAGGGDRRRSTH